MSSRMHSSSFLLFQSAAELCRSRTDRSDHPEPQRPTRAARCPTRPGWWRHIRSSCVSGASRQRTARRSSWTSVCSSCQSHQTVSSTTSKYATDQLSRRHCSVSYNMKRECFAGIAHPRSVLIIREFINYSKLCNSRVDTAESLRYSHISSTRILQI